MGQVKPDIFYILNSCKQNEVPCTEKKIYNPWIETNHKTNYLKKKIFN